MTAPRETQAPSSARVIAVIPARGGSKGIPRKNVRLLAGKPMIHYVIEATLAVEEIDAVVVSTDSDEIRYVAELAGAEVITRPPELAEDHVTLDPVIHHAVETVERERAARFDVVLTAQPTSPLLSPQTLRVALERFLSERDAVDSVLSVMDDRHLRWTQRDGRFVPDYAARVNRQQLPPQLRETGAFLITKRELVTPQSRLGARVSVFEVPEREAVDIDHPTDWWVAEKLLSRRRVLIRADGYNQIGLGHVTRALSLAHRLIDHEVTLVTEARHELGAQLFRESNFPLMTYATRAEYERILDELTPDIVINDILDTSREEVELTTRRGIFTVNFEDLGAGAEVADLVINALYEEPLPRANTCWSHPYFCLRDEFMLLDPRALSPEVSEVLITFGGTDPNDFTRRVIGLLDAYTERALKVTVILGRGYAKREALAEWLKARGADPAAQDPAAQDPTAQDPTAQDPTAQDPTAQDPARAPHTIELLHDVKSISRYMRRADLVFTSAGRTVYEVTSLGTPMIVLAQNERELLHVFARLDNGVVNLGLGARCDDAEIARTFERLIESVELRAQLRERLLSHDLRGGVDRVVSLILERYKQR